MCILREFPLITTLLVDLQGILDLADTAPLKTVHYLAILLAKQ